MENAKGNLLRIKMQNIAFLRVKMSMTSSYLRTAEAAVSPDHRSTSRPRNQRHDDDDDQFLSLLSSNCPE